MVKTKDLDRAGAVKLTRRKNAKGKGSRKELETIDILHSLGFTCTKAGGSFGKWDVVAIDDERVLLIQVKSNRWPQQMELKKLLEGPVPDFCARLIFRFDDRKPLKVATMLEKDGKVTLHELKGSVYTEAQEAKRHSRREEYHREKGSNQEVANETTDSKEAQGSGSGKPLGEKRLQANNSGGCDDGTEEGSADSIGQMGR